MRKALLAAICLATLVGSFFLCLTLLDTAAPPTTRENDRSGARALASRSIFGRSDLIEAAVGAGLHASASMRGSVDEISRVNEREVAIRGWLVDPNAEGDALDVLVFAAGKNGGMTKTQGERPDVTKALRLPFGTEKNVGFQMKVGCHPGDQLVIVGLGSDKQYFYMSSPRCP